MSQLSNSRSGRGRLAFLFFRKEGKKKKKKLFFRLHMQAADVPGPRRLPGQGESGTGLVTAPFPIPNPGAAQGLAGG